MIPTNIKWLIGSSRNGIPNQSFDMLEVSVRYMRHLLPDCKRYIAVSFLPQGMERVQKIADKYECEVYMVQGHHEIHRLPQNMSSTKRRGAWWKYIPLQIDGNQTLHLDNDFIMWRIPPALQRWLDEGGLIGYGTWYNRLTPRGPNGEIDWSKDIHFATKDEWVFNLVGNLALNSGLVGIGEHVQEFVVPLADIREWNNFVEDQAWWTVNFGLHETPREMKHIVHYEQDVPRFYKHTSEVKAKASPQSYIDKYYGGHWVTHNAGLCHYYANHCHTVFLRHLESIGA